MITKKPINAKCTERIIKTILPESFKLTEKESNGYKLINLLYGVELDEFSNNLKKLYNDSFLPTFNLSKPISIYETTISGVPNTNYLNANSQTPIKITDEYEFYNGSPTRLNLVSKIAIPNRTSGIFNIDNNFYTGFNKECSSSISGLIGIEYFKKDLRGSGYFIFMSDINQESGYLNEKYPAHYMKVNTNFSSSGDFEKIYGFFTGVKNQDYSGTLTYEVLSPIDSHTLSGQYPLSREITDISGITQIIDHYTPYLGWTRDSFGTIVPILDYSGDFYFDDSGNKIYYRTAYNNPYGYNNYNEAYLDLQYTPISGTLKVYDMDILDISGNAIEIPYSGKNLYYYKSPRMLLGSSTTSVEPEFDPVYVGYDSVVPSGREFGPNMVGSGCSLLKTTRWDYLHDGFGLDGSNKYIDGSGQIINKIKISGYHSRYIVEYKYKVYDQTKYITSLDSNGSVSYDTLNPVYSTYSSGSLIEVDYDFTRDPNYKTEKSKVITFDGIKVRPNSRINKIEFSVPMLHSESQLINNIYKNIDKSYIGYTNEFIPITNTSRYYKLNCPFDKNVSGNLIERDLTLNNNELTYSGLGLVYKINYSDYFGKKLIKTSTDSFYYLRQQCLLENTYFRFDFRINTNQDGRLLEVRDSTISGYVFFDINNDGRLSINSNGYNFISSEKIEFNNKYKSIILKYSPDIISTEIPSLKLYFKENDSLGYRIINLYQSSSTTETINSTEIKVFKNLSVDIGSFQIFYEV